VNLKQLVDRTLQAVKAESTEDVISLINDEQERVASEFLIPHRTVTQTATGSFNLPSDARAGGLRSIAVKVGGDYVQVPIYDAEMANSELPNWDTVTGSTVFFVIQDWLDADGNAQVYPVPNSAGGAWRFTYASVPAGLSAWTDEAWGGQFGQYHMLLVHYAAQELLRRAGDEKNGAYHTARYAEFLKRMRSDTSRSGDIVQNQMFKSFMGRMRRGAAFG